MCVSRAVSAVHHIKTTGPTHLLLQSRRDLRKTTRQNVYILMSVGLLAQFPAHRGIADRSSRNESLVQRVTPPSFLQVVRTSSDRIDTSVGMEPVGHHERGRKPIRVSNRLTGCLWARCRRGCPRLFPHPC